MKKPPVWTEHARFRMHLRRIPRGAVQRVLTHPIGRMKDMLTGHWVVVGKGTYGGKDRLLAVTYDERDDHIEIVTVHPIRFSQYKMRIRRGRWKPI